MPRDTILVTPTVEALFALQRHRRFTIRIQSALDRKTDSYIVSILSHDPDMVEKWELSL